MLVPDAGDVVEYGLDSFGKEPETTYRVDAWLKPYEPPVRFTGYDMLVSGAMRSDLTKEQCREALVIEVLSLGLVSVKRQIRFGWLGVRAKRLHTWHYRELVAE